MLALLPQGDETGRLTSRDEQPDGIRAHIEDSHVQYVSHSPNHVGCHEG